MTSFNEKTATSKESIARWGFDLQSTEENDDWTTAWQEVLEGKGVWGGRTRGGRGVQRITGLTQDISVEGVTLAFCGRELLQRTSLKLVHGHRYGLVGENGVGKSTLLRRLAKQTLPGIPLHFRFGYVQQELPLAEDMTVMDYILKAKTALASPLGRYEELKKVEAELEDLMEKEEDNEKLSELAQQLCDLVEEMEKVEVEVEEEKQLLAQRALPSTSTSTSAGLTRADIEALGSRVTSILDGLGLSKPPKRLSLRLSALSGGWRMRAALAQVLINLHQIDVLLLDEPTNHLDLPSIAWLQSFLSEADIIILLVSHDRSFLNAITTDIIEMKNYQLNYFPGGYEDFLMNKEELLARKQNALDARSRKEGHIQKTIEQAKARGDDNTVRTKQKKLERAAFTRGIDGHKFKLFSLSKMDESAIHMPEIIEAGGESDLRQFKFKFPAVDAAALRLSNVQAPVLTMEKCTLAYLSPQELTGLTGSNSQQAKNRVTSGGVRSTTTTSSSSQPAAGYVPLLDNITLQLTMQSRVGIIGRNGKGKSSLLYTLAYAHSLGAVAVPGLTHATTTEPSKSTGPRDCSNGNDNNRCLSLVAGHIWKHHNLRIGVVAQHQIDILSDFLWSTPMDYMTMLVQQYNRQQQPSNAVEDSLLAANGSSGSVAGGGGGGVAGLFKYTELELRAHLGSFGLSGNLALQKIGSLSGGQKARLSFAAVCVLRPHLLFLDEPTNHLSMESIEALIKACQDFMGGIVVVSHNRYFLSQVCNELFVVTPPPPPPTPSGGKGGSSGSSSSSSSGAIGQQKSNKAVFTISVRKGERGEGGSDSHNKVNQQKSFEELLERAIQEQMLHP